MQLLRGMSSELSAEAGEQPAIEWMILHHLAIIFLTLIGNTLLIYVILKNNIIRRRKRVTPVQMLMLHMCAADLLFALITMVPTMAMTATVPIFHGPDILCKIVKFLQVIPMYASSFLLVAISADRFQAICRPLASMKSNAYKRPAFYASVAWALALLFSTPQFALFTKSQGDCVGTYTSPYQYALYVVVFNSVVWLLPSALAGYLYYRVCKAVWQSTSFGSAFQTNGTAGQVGFSSAGMQLHHKGATMQCVELDRRRVQTVKLTLTIVAGNFILWAPFCITSVIDALWPTAINPTFATYIMFFGNLNSFMNPWIWFYFNRAQFRRALPCYNATDPLLL
ncbi:7 transmembrane receptor [Oesophagostomum dentatum]|uniref:7 transmembrane receptor n=1 Tax=Oesophagostomum dentatum TaxID=61180 RepID=A0A0B1TA68_OESDE|nr:7 transmembrane receptor [Oesophagostomum dentatum]